MNSCALAGGFSCWNLWADIIFLDASKPFVVTSNFIAFVIPAFLFTLFFSLVTRRAMRLISNDEEDGTLKKYAFILCWLLSALLLLRAIEFGLGQGIRSSSAWIMATIIQCIFAIIYFVIELILLIWIAFGYKENKSLVKIYSVILPIGSSLFILSLGIMLLVNREGLRTSPFFFAEIKLYWIIIDVLWVIAYIATIIVKRKEIVGNIKAARRKSHNAQLFIMVSIHLLMVIARGTSYGSNTSYCFVWPLFYISHIIPAPIVYCMFLYKHLHKSEDIYMSSEALSSDYVKEARYSKLKSVN